MKLTRVFEFTWPKASLPAAAQLDRSMRALLLRARREWARSPRTRAADFQDTQPSIHGTQGRPE